MPTDDLGAPLGPLFSDDPDDIRRSRSLGARPVLLDRERGGGPTWKGAVVGLLNALGADTSEPVPDADGYFTDPMREMFGERLGTDRRLTREEWNARRTGMAIAGGFGDGGAAGITRRVAAPIRAYHGTPHRFDDFDISKIGSGEGAQVYGSGLYFTETEAIARGYRDRLSGQLLVDGAPLPKGASPQTQHIAGLMASGIDMAGAQRQALLDFQAMTRREAMLLDRRANGVAVPAREMRDTLAAKEKAAEQLRAFEFLSGKQVGANPGHLYEVDLHAPRDRLLDWDRPLSRQPPPVRDALAERGLAPVEPAGGIESGRLFDHYQQYRIRGADGSAAVATDNGPNGWWLTLHDAQGRELTRRKVQAEKENMADAMKAMVRQDHSGGDAYRILTDRERERLGAGGLLRYGPDGRRIDDDAANVSSGLRTAGVEGVQYLDGSSRGKKAGTSNFVAFSDDMVEILRRYGLVGMVGGAAAGASAE